ncbi:hypothetical protein [Absidia glauca]|uniref:Uncharacterized protein n=1 Tax=Absidia glauca TaxID=4829 RepID=A0A168KSF1_ABSGL|nr:hypothetical protein [Absidia glauca]
MLFKVEVIVDLKDTCTYFFSSCIDSTTTLVLATLIDKRAPPFPQSANLPAHLGNYTHSHENVEKPTYTCVLLGDCDVCTSLEKKTAPYCLEYGNKEPVHCEWDDPNWMTNKNDTSYDHDDDMISLPTYRACPYVKRIEKWRLISSDVGLFFIGYQRCYGGIISPRLHLEAAQAGKGQVPANGRADWNSLRIDQHATLFRVPLVTLPS